MILFTFALGKLQNEQDKNRILSLYQEHHKLWFHIAYKILLNQSRAEDAIQEAFLSIIETFETIKEAFTKRPVAYIAVCIRNAALDIRKKSSREIATDKIDTFIQADAADPFATFETRTDINSFFRQVEALSEKEYTIIINRYYLDMSDAEIGALVGLAPDSVRCALSRARKKIRRAMSKGERYGYE